LFAELFRQQAGQSRRAPGADLRYRLSVGFLDAVNGASKRIILPDGGNLNVTIPAGINEVQTLRLRGKGAQSAGEGAAGDALVEISIPPHRFFTRIGDDIHLELPITLTEAVLSARIKTPTPSGSVMLAIPKGSNTGAVLRLKGKGVAHRGGHGDESWSRSRSHCLSKRTQSLKPSCQHGHRGQAMTRAGRCRHDDHKTGVSEPHQARPTDA
jgi:DnaJ-class molecular chaperone